MPTGGGDIAAVHERVYDKGFTAIHQFRASRRRENFTRGFSQSPEARRMLIALPRILFKRIPTTSMRLVRHSTWYFPHRMVITYSLTAVSKTTRKGQDRKSSDLCAVETGHTRRDARFKFA
jgi:hypothetical protein